MGERPVRFTQQFFDRLDLLFPEDRTADGDPSRMDFLLYELPRVRDQLAQDFEANTVPSEDGDVRLWFGGGIFVRTIAVYAYVADDDVVDVIGLLVGWRRTGLEDDDDAPGDP